MAADEERRAWKYALARTVKRAERNDEKSLADTFVELPDLTMRIFTEENQILFGRRGTGKSHAFHHLKNSVCSTGSTAVLLDLRTLGSAGGYYLSVEGGRSLAALHIVVDLLSSLHNEIYELSLRSLEEGSDVTQLVRAMDRLAEAAAEVTIDGPTSRSKHLSENASDSSNISLKLSPQPSLGASLSRKNSSSSDDAYSTQGVERPALNLGQVSKALVDLIGELPNKRLWLLLDEWSAVPLDVQPIVADFLRRCFLPVRGMVLKIAAVERRSRLWATEESGYMGLEMGSDIGAALDLDEYLGQGLKSSSFEFYLKILTNHMRVATRNGAYSELLVNDAALKRLLPNFPEAVYLAAGIPRDLLSILGIAAANWLSRSKIEFPDLASAARQFFTQEKEAQARLVRGTQNLSSTLREYAENGNTRFFVDRDYSHQSGELLELLDQRIIHLLGRAIGPRGKYDLFAIDLGMVADLLAKEDKLPSNRNPWANWDYANKGQKIPPALRFDGHRITWRSLA